MRERRPIWPGELAPDVQRIWQKMYDHLCQHLVCLGVRFETIDDQGVSSGPQKLLRLSCFVVSLRDKWFLVTAGHALKEIADTVAARKIRVVHAFLVDYFGHREVVRGITSFPYETTQQFVDEPTLGLDYGFIPLSDFFKAGLQANGIIALSEQHWTLTQHVEFASYVVLGFPADVATDYGTNSELADPLSGSLGTVVISAEQLLDKSQIPEGVDPAVKSGPWFVGRITADTTLNIKGMSGGPIFGLCRSKDGNIGYSVVAIQSRWHQSSKVIFGCPIELFGKMVETYESGLLATVSDTVAL